MADSIEKAKQEVWQIVHAIPEGNVATYGQVARLAGMPRKSRLVGSILARLPAGTKLPWHRVINAQGRLSNPNPARQRERLEAEGITFINGRINLKRYGWDL